jgi:hypothetical protein
MDTTPKKPPQAEPETTTPKKPPQAEPETTTPIEAGIDKGKLVEDIVKAVRKNPRRFAAMMRRKSYFAEDNGETAVVNAMNAGGGRKVRRELARKMLVSWSDYLEFEDLCVENLNSSLTNAAKIAYRQRKLQQLLDKKITKREYRVAIVVCDEGVDYGMAEKIAGYGKADK